MNKCIDCIYCNLEKRMCDSPHGGYFQDESVPRIGIDKSSARGWAAKCSYFHPDRLLPKQEDTTCIPSTEANTKPEQEDNPNHRRLECL